MAVSAVTSLMLPLAEGEVALATIYGVSGLGIAAFTPSALSFVADIARPGRIAKSYAWYSTAHYGAIAVGPFLGGLATQWWGYRPAFLASAALIGVAFVVGFEIPRGHRAHPATYPRPTFADIRNNWSVSAGWVASLSGMLIQGVVFTFFPLLASARGVGPGTIGLVFLVLGLANTVARFPAGWLIDRRRRYVRLAIAGLLAGSLAIALLPHVEAFTPLLTLAAAFGAVSGLAFVAISTALAASATPHTRGLVMGGYSTSMYLGLALGSFGLGPVIRSHGHPAGFFIGGAAGLVGTMIAAGLWQVDRRSASASHDVVDQRRPSEAAP
jgi:predicted MFS family arabinose efflux permease